MIITILGSGSSGGVPLATGDWGECDPANPKNRRTRASIHIDVDGLSFIVDTGADFRNQLLANTITKIDAVLYTHAHADHIFGMDDLRHFYFKQKQPTPIYADDVTLGYLKQAYGYAFKAPSDVYQTFITPHEFTNDPFNVLGIKIQPVKMDHTVMTSWGFRIRNFAYCTDFKRIEATELEKLKNLDTIIIDCLMFDDHKTHVKFDETMAIIDTIKPKHAIFTHMNQHMDYETALKKCPAHVEPGYDGMQIILNDSC